MGYCLINDKPHYLIGEDDDLITRWEFIEQFVLTGRFMSAKTIKTKMFWSQTLPAIGRIQRAWRRYKSLQPYIPVSWKQQREQALARRKMVETAVEEALRIQSEAAERQKREREDAEFRAAALQNIEAKKRRRHLYDKSRVEYNAARVLCSFAL